MTLEEAAARLRAVVGEVAHGATAVTIPIHEWRDFIMSMEIPVLHQPIESPPPVEEPPADEPPSEPPAPSDSGDGEEPAVS